MATQGKSRRPIVMPWPDPRFRENPYLKLMYRALKREGVRIKHPPMRFASCASKRVDWLHMHWPGWLTRASSAEEKAAKQAEVLRVLDRARENGVKVLWTMHNELPHDSPYEELEREFLEQFLKRCDVVHKHFPSADAALMRFGYEGKTVLVPHGSYGEFYGKRVDKETARKRHELPLSATVLLSFGLIRPYKRHHLAIEAFKKIDAPLARLVIAGRAPDADYLRDLEERSAGDSRIRLIAKAIPNRAIPSLLCAADAFVLSSQRFFTSGSAVLALDHGLPIVGVEKNHLTLLAEHGLLFPWDGDTSESLSAAFDEVTANLSPSLTARVRAYADTHRWSDVIEPLANVLCC